ncbi:hypothetical protein GGQ22_12255 [Nocardioides sp. zg-579]|uniref:Uncharacterized protein n=1 Tax=Nocardioides marmotae TaxID=2663857 RepID=A0A6I3JCT9_9ACTN|nr:hypothetical protein [Nocardioides marmotae]MCR6032206.1 hypothetical protein [Gordonia jinghuaiqii]MTB95853.1 hypothetical protein [Nocardioides marmotae]QKE02797.1 hypothetical protein HPC71_18280 [Nocardioides marmotae]
MTRVVLVPGVLALLPEHASQVDPVAELRAAAVEAVRWLGDGVQVVADAQGERVADALLAEAGVARGGAAAYLVVGNGSAKRSEKAPGHLDERAFAFDDALRAALVAGDLSGVDWTLAEELWASVDGIRRAADLVAGPATVDYDDDPYGVAYWVMRWGS